MNSLVTIIPLIVSHLVAFAVGYWSKAKVEARQLESEAKKFVGKL